MEVQVQRAKLLAEASLMPESYRRQPANVLMAMEVSESLGISLMQAIQGVTVIKGKLTMSAELMRALVLRAGHQLRVDTLTEQGCRMVAARREWPDDVQTFEFTMADAQRAGLVGQGGNYGKFPKAMLLARCTTMACRAVFPDVIAGVSYAPEELVGPARPVVATARLHPNPVPVAPPGVVVDEDGVMWEHADVEDPE
jgi:hypothetical protein